MFRVVDELGFVNALRKRNLLINAMDEGLFRAVTHLDVSAADIEDALGRIAEIAGEGIR